MSNTIFGVVFMHFPKQLANIRKEESLLLQFEAIEQLEDKERAVIMELIYCMLLKHDAKRWMQSR